MSQKPSNAIIITPLIKNFRGDLKPIEDNFMFHHASSFRVEYLGEGYADVNEVLTEVEDAAKLVRDILDSSHGQAFIPESVPSDFTNMVSNIEASADMEPEAPAPAM